MFRNIVTVLQPAGAFAPTVPPGQKNTSTFNFRSRTGNQNFSHSARRKGFSTGKLVSSRVIPLMLFGSFKEGGASKKISRSFSTGRCWSRFIKYVCPPPWRAENALIRMRSFTCDPGDVPAKLEKEDSKRASDFNALADNTIRPSTYFNGSKSGGLEPALHGSFGLRVIMCRRILIEGIQYRPLPV